MLGRLVCLCHHYSMTKFPIKLPALWRQIYPALLIAAIVGQGYEWLQGGSFNLTRVMPMLMAASVFYVLHMYWFCPTLAGVAGLKLINGWGWRRRVAWSEIVEVHQARRLKCIPSLRVVCASGQVYWFDTEIANLAKLHSIALEAGGPEHPLVMALSTPQYAL